MTETTPGGAIAGRATLTQDDGVATVRAARARGVAPFLHEGRLLLYGAAASWVAAILAYDGAHRTTIVFLVVSTLLFVAAFVVAPRRKRALGKRFAHGQERDIVVNDDGVTISEPGMRVAYAWSRFDRAFENADYFAAVAPGDVVVLPKRAFAADDVERVRAMIAQRVAVVPLT